MERGLHKTYKKLKKIFGNTFKTGSIQSRITISFTLLTVSTMLIVGIVLYRKFSGTIAKNGMLSSSQIIDQVNSNLEEYIKGMIEISNILGRNLKTANLDENEHIDNILNMTLEIRRDIATIVILSQDGRQLKSTIDKPLKSNLDVRKESWFRDAEGKPEMLNFSIPHVQNLYTGEHKWVVSLSRKIGYKENGKIKNGISLVDLNFSKINELCHNVSLGKRGYVYIIDRLGDIIYHPQQQMIYAGIKEENIRFAVTKRDGSYVENYNGEPAIVNVKSVGYTGWKLVGICYLNEIEASSKDIYYYVFFVILFGIILVISISFMISSKISQPIKRLEKVMRKVEQGELDIFVEEKGEEEVRQLSKSFNIMIYRIRQLMDQIITEQEEKRKNQLVALESQINPHFLYNTLDSIIWMAESGNLEGVVNMVTALASLFRISISKGKEIISLRDEIEHARNYLIIQQMRYEDKFDFTIDVNEQILKYKTQKLILQPIIENAIYHGLNKMVDRGTIQIVGDLSGDKICLKIIDNGSGMAPEIAAGLLNKDSKGRPDAGIGLKNVNERIKLSFGNEYGLEIVSELDEGTCVMIWLPCHISEEGCGNFEINQ